MDVSQIHSWSKLRLFGLIWLYGWGSYLSLRRKIDLASFLDLEHDSVLLRILKKSTQWRRLEKQNTSEICYHWQVSRKHKFRWHVFPVWFTRNTQNFVKFGKMLVISSKNEETGVKLEKKWWLKKKNKRQNPNTPAHKLSEILIRFISIITIWTRIFSFMEWVMFIITDCLFATS